MEKIEQKEHFASMEATTGGQMEAMGGDAPPALNPKVVEVYTSIGQMLKRYTAGKLPKAFKIIPALKNWEEIVWITQPYEWSPAATFAATQTSWCVRPRPRRTPPTPLLPID